MSQANINTVKSYLLELQDSLCQMLEAEDGKAKFHEDKWQHTKGPSTVPDPDGGGGKTRVLTGSVIEKAGVNFSHILGNQLPQVILQQSPGLAGRSYQATGVSTIVHPYNPYAPTAHMNVRFFIAEKANAEPLWWFGGGFDLTPYYGFKEDCVLWHQMAKDACDPFGENVYSDFKQACDKYFFLQHRNEPRGIGGIFYDHVNVWGFEKCFAFMQNVGNNFLKAYQTILQRRKKHPYEEKEREFQCYRRGRYVEFNLIYDRGTLFGLQTAGRTESILVSLPPQVKWIYDWQPKPKSKEAELYKEYLVSKDWLKEN